MNMPKPSIGVAMCTYNGEKFVAEQIESILAQTLPPVLIHVFDDGSADRTLEILQELWIFDYNFTQERVWGDILAT